MYTTPTQNKMPGVIEMGEGGHERRASDSFGTLAVSIRGRLRRGPVPEQTFHAFNSDGTAHTLSYSRDLCDEVIAYLVSMGLVERFEVKGIAMVRRV